MVVSKKDTQKEAHQKYQENIFEEFKELEEQRAKEVLLELVQMKHELFKWEGERERAIILQRLGGSRATRHWNDPRDIMSVESCSSSMACVMEEAGSEFSRKMKDKEETTAVTKGKEKEVWRLEPEGEAEKPEATARWSGVKGVSVSPGGESRHGQARAKMARKEIENRTQMEEKVDGKAPGDEGAEVQSPK